jgi:hypothetical protein
MKKFITTTALVTTIGFASFVPTVFAQTSVVTPTVTPVPHYNQAVASWTKVAGAKCYNLYYRRVGQTSWKHSVGCVPNNMTSYTVQGLRQKVSYEYTVSALTYAGKETAWTTVAPLVATPMAQ